MPTTFEKDWQLPDVNRPHFGASTAVIEMTRSQLFYIKALLTGAFHPLGHWTVVSCSDGFTFKNDGTDLWGLVYDGTKINRGLAAFNQGTATPSASGGSLASGTYRLLLVPVNENGMLGQPALSESSAVVTGPNGSISIPIPFGTVAGATSFRVYVTPPNGASGSENVYYTATASPFVVTGVGSTPGTPPALGTPSGRSHMTLRSPDFTAGGIVNTPFYLTIEFTGAQDYTVSFIFSKAAPTGGSITARPIATDEWGHSSISLNAQAAAQLKHNGWLSSDGNFAFLWAIPGAGNCPQGFMFQVFSDARPNDMYPAASIAGWMGSTATQFFNGQWVQSSSWAARSHNGAAVVNGCMAWSRGVSDPTISMQNTGDATDGSFSGLLTHFLVTTSGWWSYRGRFVDFVAAIPGVSINTQSEPPTGSPTSQIIGSLYVPLAGTPVTF